MDAHYHIIADNFRKQYETKQNLLQINAVKKSSHITKQGRSFKKILYTVDNLQSDNDNTNNSPTP